MIHPIPAYLDPTSGSIAFQVAISSLLAVAAAFRLYWDKVKHVIHWKRTSEVGREPRGGQASHRPSSTD
ncbi:MAG: hypothetical protein ACE141_03555 [Bryobacteraceae bacterium]